MKNVKICPKCRDTDIFVVKGRADAYGVGNNIPVGMTVFSYALVNRYICSACGFTEGWINTEDMPRLKKKYAK